MNESDFQKEKEFLARGYDFVIGIDEAGRGPLAGPVVAAACSIRTLDVLLGHPMSKMIRDSKLLSEKQRENLFDFIQENFFVGVGICDHKTIDRINILEATYLAMKKAIADLNKNLKKGHSRAGGNLLDKTKPQDWIPAYAGMTNMRQIILVDGNKKIPNLSMDQEAIVGGDRFVKSISAASIIAKVTRDRMMHEAHLKYPEYNFAQHKGYGTKIHMEALRHHGSCEIHRMSFGPVKKSRK